MPVGGSGGDDRKVAKPGQRHVQGAGDRRGGQGQQVGPAAQCFQLLLVANPEALFFVDDYQPQVVELHVVLQQPVGADNDVQLALGEVGEDLALLPGSAEARDRLDPHRPVGEPILEGLAVLLREQGGGSQDGGLAAVEGGNEGGAHPDLGLAETDVAADDPVHRRAVRQAVQYFANGLGLVRGLVEREPRLELRVVRGDFELAPALCAAPRLHLQQFGRGVVGALGRPALDFLPLVPAQRVQRRIFRVRAAVAGNPVQFHDRHVQPVRVGVLDEQELLFDFVDFQLAQPLVTSDPIVLVNHRAAVLEIGQFRQDGLGVPAAALAVLLGRPVREQVGFGDDRDPGLGEIKTLFDIRHRQRQARPLLQELRPVRDRLDRDVQRLQAFLQLFAPPRGVGREQDLSGRGGEELAQGAGGSLVLRPHLEFRQCAGRVVEGLPVRLPLVLEAGQGELPVAGQRLLQLGSGQVQHRHWQGWMLGVSGAGLETGFDLVQGAGLRHRPRPPSTRLRSQQAGSRTDLRPARRTGAGSTRCRPGRWRR